MKRDPALTNQETVEQRIFLIRGHKVMLSVDLAELYGVEPRASYRPSSVTGNGFPKMSCSS